MKVNDAIILAQELMSLYLDKTWGLQLNKRHAALGCCNFNKKKIYLSVHFIEHNDEKQVTEIILHEIAHAIAGLKAGHGPKWAKECRRLGIEPIVRYHDANMPVGKYTAVCKKCNHRYNKHRKPMMGYQYMCPKCKVLVDFVSTQEK